MLDDLIRTVRSQEADDYQVKVINTNTDHCLFIQHSSESSDFESTASAKLLKLFSHCLLDLAYHFPLEQIMVHVPSFIQKSPNVYVNMTVTSS